jgi:DNA (cytosine-5)-methyltransferase 1
VNELALFAGAGGGILAGHLLGWRTVCAVELDTYAASVLVARQNDGYLPPFPVWDDVRTFDGNQWRGRVGVISGGFPCQDISVAGKGSGITGERSGLWKEFARIIGEVRPNFVYVENSPAITCRGLGVVLGDLASLGYNAEWGVLGAGHIGAWHLRERFWLVASDNREKRVQGDQQIQVSRKPRLSWCENVGRLEDLRSRPDLPVALVRRTRDGMAHYVDRISAIGNGQFPAVGAIAWNALRQNAARL